MNREGRALVLSVSMRPEHLRELQVVAAERTRRGEGGGISGAIRELLAAELARRRRATMRRTRAAA